MSELDSNKIYTERELAILGVKNTHETFAGCHVYTEGDWLILFKREDGGLKPDMVISTKLAEYCRGNVI